MSSKWLTSSPNGPLPVTPTEPWELAFFVSLLMVAPDREPVGSYETQQQ